MSANSSTPSPTSGFLSDDDNDLTADLDLGFDGAEDLLRVWRQGLRPDPNLTVSEWADQHRWLSSRGAAEPGRYRTARAPYLREIMDALSPGHPAQRITFMKAAQVGATEAGNNWIGFVIHHAPGPMLAVLPSLELAKRTSRGRLDPLIADSPALRERVNPARSRDAGNSMLSKEFPGGILVLTGANSATGLRSMPARYVFLDEVDAYPASADEEGDPVTLAEARTTTFSHRRKVFMVSTPTIRGLSRIEREFEASDQRRYFVPCPHCGAMQWLQFDRLRRRLGHPASPPVGHRGHEGSVTMVLDAFRQRIGSIIGGFDAAQSHRRMRGFRATRAHVNTLIAASGETITARARWLVRNNGYAANAVDAFANHVVGDGIKPSSKIADAAKKEELQKLWLAWTDEADAEGLTDFFGLQRRAAREVFLAGEVFLRIRARRPEDGLTVPMQLQMLPSEMLPQDMTRVLPGAGSIRQGIEFDGIGRRVAYHFLRRHPGDLTDPGLIGETVRVPASEVIHILDPVEAGQLRGVSRFAAAVVKLFTLDLYDDAELERKKTAAMFAMFITSPAPETALDPAEDDLEVEPGQVVRLDPGEDVTTPSTPDSGSTYEPFQYRTLLQIGAALGVPYGYLTGDTAKGNFSNTRIALVDFRRRVSALQHSVMVYQLCRAVWTRWMDMAVLAGAIDLPGYATERRQYLACDWLPTKWDWIDPAKDAAAEILQIEAGLKSRTQAIAERGYDAEQVDREIAAERKREAELGLDFRRPGSPAQAAGGGAAPRDAEGQQRDQQDTDDQEDDGEDREPRPAEDA